MEKNREHHRKKGGGVIASNMKKLGVSKFV